MARDDIHIVSDEFDDDELIGFDEVEDEDDDEGEEVADEDLQDDDVELDEDLEAGEDEDLEERGLWIPDSALPETQGWDLNVAELGEEGNGDLAPEDL